MQTLITGGSGFLGRNIYDYLDQKAIRTYFSNQIKNGYFADLTKERSVKSLFELFNPDVVIHCAANPSPKHPEDYQQFVNDHIMATTHLLEACKPGSHFIYISSILVYGDCYPVEYPSNLYGACKASCENICRAYAQLKKLKLNIIRPCAIVGNGLTHGLLYDIKRKLSAIGKELELFGDSPGTIKPFVHVDDVCRCIKTCIGKNYEIMPETINCFPHDSLSVKQVAELVMSEMKINKSIKWLGKDSLWKGDNKLINTSKFRLENDFNLEYKTSKLAIQNSLQGAL